MMDSTWPWIIVGPYQTAWQQVRLFLKWSTPNDPRMLGYQTLAVSGCITMSLPWRAEPTNKHRRQQASKLAAAVEALSPLSQLVLLHLLEVLDCPLHACAHACCACMMNRTWVHVSRRVLLDKRRRTKHFHSPTTSVPASTFGPEGNKVITNYRARNLPRLLSFFSCRLV
jgi:hypothetical protein